MNALPKVPGLMAFLYEENSWRMDTTIRIKHAARSEVSTLPDIDEAFKGCFEIPTGDVCQVLLLMRSAIFRQGLLFRTAATRPDEAVRDSVVQCGRGAIPVRSRLKSVWARPRSVAEVYYYPRFHHAGEFLDVPIGKPDASV